MCAGLSGGCPDCRGSYLAWLRTFIGGREPEVGVCMVCGHRHWPWEPHADHQWTEVCRYDGIVCGLPPDAPVGVP